MYPSLARSLCKALYVFVLFSTFTIYAQDLDDVSFSGNITDINGLAVAGASVTATHVESGIKRTTVTDSEGNYRIVELRPGTYSLAVSAPGFGTQVRTDVESVSGRNFRLDVSLAPGDIEAETTVSADDEDISMIDTTRTVVGSTITAREIDELPNFGRDALDLVLTLGGTSEEALSVRDLAEDRDSNYRVTPSEQGNFSLSGGASYSNNLTIDGLDNNDDRSARDRFQPPLEAVAEVQVIRNQFSAEYGRASGGRVNLRTRAGTNRYRGRVFLNFRDDHLNANSWYNNSRGYPRLPMREYTPGFSFGGPLSIPGLYNGRRRTFFNVSYEHRTLEDTTFINTYIPVSPNPRFGLPTPNGSGIFCDSPTAEPPCAGDVGEVAGYTNMYSTPNTQHSFIGRIDHKLTAKNDLTFGFQFGRRKNRRTSGASTTRIEDALQSRNVNTEAFNFTDNHVIGAKGVNQFKFQWSSYTPSYQTDDPLAPVVLIGYRNPETNSVQTLIAGNSTSSSLQNFADRRREVRYQIQDSLTWVAGSHTIKTGFDIQNVRSVADSLSDATGTYNFNNVFNYTNNSLTRYRQNFGTVSDVENTYWALFINDEWRFAPSFTFSFGVRYERETVLDDTNNFGPRAAIAWDPFKDGKTVIRAGAGMFYNRTLLRTVGDFIQNSLAGLEPFDTNTIPTTNNARGNILAAIAQGFPNGYASAADLRAVIASANCGPANAPVNCSPDTGFIINSGTSGNPLRSIEPGLRIPEAYNFNVGFERELGRGFVLEANYTFNRGAHLWREYNVNAPVLPAGYSDLTAYLLDQEFVFTNASGRTRTYRFYLGSTTDTSGLATTPGGTSSCNSNANTDITCWVNLNTVSTSTTAPNTNASDGVSSNSIGGPIGIAREAIRHLRPNPAFDEMARVASLGNSRYHGLVLELRSRSRRLGNGFRAYMRAAYTLSKTMDDGLNNTSNAEVDRNFAREWARAGQDRRHRLAISGTFDTPNWLGRLRFSPVFRYGSSAPFNLGYGIDRNLNDQSTDRVQFSGDLKELVWREPGSPEAAELLAKFSLQPIGSNSGNIPRNAGRGPSQYIFDMNISREWRLRDRMRLRGNVEVNNVFNMAVFSFGAEYVDFIGVGANPTAAQQRARQNFLVPTRTYRARDIRLGLRFEF